MTVDWRDICPRCEAVLEMPGDGSLPDHVCSDRAAFLRMLHDRRIRERIKAAARMMYAQTGVQRMVMQAAITGVARIDLNELIDRDIEAQRQELLRRRNG